MASVGCGGHAVASSSVGSLPVSARVAGQGQEDLVQAGLAEREVVDGDAGAGQLGQRPGRPARRRPTSVAVRRRAVSATGSASSCTGAPSAAASTRSRRRPLRRRRAAAGGRCPRRPTTSARPGCPRRSPCRGRSTAIRSASWSASSRYCVVSSTVVPCGDERPGRCPRPGCGCAGRDRSSARRGTAGRGVLRMLAAMSSRRRMPPGVLLHLRSAASVRPNAAEQLAAPRPAPPACGSPSSRASSTRFSRAGEVLVDRGVLPGQADPAAYRVGLARPRRGRTPGPRRRRGAAAWPASGRRWSCRRRSGRARRRRVPAGTRRSMPSTARFSPNTLTRPDVSIAGASLMICPLRHVMTRSGRAARRPAAPAPPAELVEQARDRP